MLRIASNLWISRPVDGKPSDAIWETAVFAGEPIVLVLAPRGGELKVTSVMRLETCEDQVAIIARLKAGA